MGKLTAESVKNIKANATRCEYPDAVCPGLGLIVQASGVKSWAVRYRLDGKRYKVTLGTYPRVPLSEADDDRKARLARDPKSDPPDARGLARAVLAAVATGRNPSIDRKEARRKELAGIGEAEAMFSRAWEKYVAQHVEPNLRSSSQKELKRLYKNRLEPLWGKRRLDEITPNDIEALKVKMRATPDMADKMLSFVRAFFNWCKASPRKWIAINPCEGIAKTERSKDEIAQREEDSDRILSDNEIRWLWKAARNVGYPFGPIAQLLILKGARRREVAGITDGEIHPEKRLWVLPGWRAKNGVKLEVHLCDTALAIIKKLPKIAGENEQGFRFTTTGKTAVSGFSKGKEALDREMLAVARAEIERAGHDPKKVKIEQWTLHDLRRTFVSGCAKLGINKEVVRRCINHISSGDKRDRLDRIYDRHDYAPEMRAAFEAWSSYVKAVVENEPLKNVVQLQAKR